MASCDPIFKRAGLAIGTLLIAAIATFMLLPTPNALAGKQLANSHHPAHRSGGRRAAVDANCLSLPKNFSKPRVIAASPPAKLWHGWTYNSKVKLSVKPEAALKDRPVAIRVTGLKPHEPLTLRAVAKDFKGNHWTATATFVATAHGTIDVTRTAPRYGNYSGVHPMGIIWSMARGGVKYPDYATFIPKGHRYRITLAALAHGRVLARRTLKRFYKAAGVKQFQVKAQGLVGELFKPTTPGPHPALIVLGGSEGGLHPQEAALLASHGYVALGLAYFQGSEKLPKLPKQLVNIPLEYFAKAGDWLKQQSGVDPNRIGIVGWSKGAEAALIVAATYPEDFHAVVAYGPSSVVNAGIRRGPGPETSSWSLNGKPLPFAFYRINPKMLAGGKPVSYVLALNALRNAPSNVQIPVERIAGPVMLISGTDDRIWPSTIYAQRIMARLRAHHHNYLDRSICYSGAGHMILPPYRPTITTGISFGHRAIPFGGNTRIYAFADPNSWHKVLKFLRRALVSK